MYSSESKLNTVPWHDSDMIIDNDSASYVSTKLASSLKLLPIFEKESTNKKH